MAVRNAQSGGNDFISGESVYPNDMNDTFDDTNIIPVGVISQ